MCNIYSNFWRYSQTEADKFGRMIQSTSLTINHNELRADITEWTETLSSMEHSSSCTIITVIQRSGTQEQLRLPQVYSSLGAARADCTKTLAEIMNEFGAKDYTADIRNGRLFITTDNRVKITMVLDK